MVFTLCMMVLMVLFLAVAMQRQSDVGDGRNPAQTQDSDDTGTSNDGESGDSSDTSEIVTGGTDLPDTTPPDTTPPVTTPPETTPPVTNPPDSTEPPPDKIPTEYDEELLAEVALPLGTAPAGYVDSLVFYGDSTTHGMKAYKVFGSRDTTQVWTPTSGTLALFRAATDLVWNPNTKTEMTIADLCANVKPEYLIVTLGVNGVSMMDESWFKADYQGLINIIRANSPDTKLILQSIYPVARSYQKQKSINNTKIQQANKWIVELAKDNGLPYLNTYSALVGSDGYLPESYQNGDGMHFNEIGFAAVIDYVKTHPYTN
ncbi:MAG: hypothetical protein J6S76_05115 [Clostridia bacterium]|nr:hypothetical protein [Clostridia bacterium]